MLKNDQQEVYRISVGLKAVALSDSRSVSANLRDSWGHSLSVLRCVYAAACSARRC